MVLDSPYRRAEGARIIHSSPIVAACINAPDIAAAKTITPGIVVLEVILGQIDHIQSFSAQKPCHVGKCHQSQVSGRMKIWSALQEGEWCGLCPERPPRKYPQITVQQVPLDRHQERSELITEDF
jgi:hypothetical protein